jgi:hypothetical protein
MATTTPNFGWAVPTSTDLVKDGAVAIETLGDSIDASLVDLKGGTTGQVLAKASGTDMDFSWVAQDDSNAIQNAIVDAKGDLIAASANDTPARLAVGANGETLVADSSTSTGLRYTAGTVQANPVINAAMQVWQRGTSFPGPGNIYTADRWLYSGAAGRTVSRQATGDTTNLPFIQYGARVQRDSGNTNTLGFSIVQNFETVNSIPYAGKTVTLSFYAKVGANYSTASSALEVNLATGTGTDQNLLTGFTGRSNVILTNQVLTTTYARYSFTATLSSTMTQIALNFSATPTGTAGANDWFEITGVQIDIGSVALPFRTYAGTIQGELAACQRYYFRTNYSTEATGSEAGSVFGHGFIYSSTAIYPAVQHPVVMRVKPTSMDFSNLRYEDWTGTTGNLSAATMNNTNTLMTRIVGTVSGAGANRYCQLQASASNGYIGFSAEL